MILFFLFVVLPFVEFTLLMRLGAALGFVPTVLLVMVTGVIGARLARQQGLGVLSSMQEELGRGQVPSQEISHGLLILLAGALLVTPGVITDVVGFFLLVPWTRAMVQPWVVAQIKKRLGKGKWTTVQYGGTTSAQDGVRSPGTMRPKGTTMDNPAGPVVDVEVVDEAGD